MHKILEVLREVCAQHARPLFPTSTGLLIPNKILYLYMNFFLFGGWEYLRQNLSMQS